LAFLSQFSIFDYHITSRHQFRQVAWPIWKSILAKAAKIMACIALALIRPSHDPNYHDAMADL
jgi:hypothetical protein